MDCYGYDLKRDPNRKQKITPLLNKSGLGNLKNFELPFLEEVKANELFKVGIHSKSPSSILKKDYLFVSTNSTKKTLNIKTRIDFIDFTPVVRVYHVLNHKSKLVKTIIPKKYKWK